MHRIDHPTANGDQFTEGNPAQSVPATVVTDDWLNDLQNNIATVIENAGVSLTKNRAADLRDALNSLYAQLSGATFTGQVISQYTDPQMSIIDPDGGLLRMRVFSNTARFQVDQGDSLVIEGQGNTDMSEVRIRTSTGSHEVMHQDNLGGEFTFQAAQNGQHICPSGMITKWGRIPTPAFETDTVFPFPTAFPTACFNVQLTAENSNGSSQRASDPHLVALSAANITYRVQQMDAGATNVTGIFYTAIGH